MENADVGGKQAPSGAVRIPHHPKDVSEAFFWNYMLFMSFALWPILLAAASVKLHSRLGLNLSLVGLLAVMGGKTATLAVMFLSSSRSTKESLYFWGWTKAKTQRVALLALPPYLICLHGPDYLLRRLRRKGNP